MSNELKIMKYDGAKNIAVIGVGGVGGFFGGKMAQTARNLYFVARGKHLDEIRKNGLRLESKEAGTLQCRPVMATGSIADLPMLDICFLCVKEYDLNHTVVELAARLKPETILIPLLNGVDIPERIRKITDLGVILPACVYIGTHIESPGVVVQDGGACKIYLGKPAVPVVEQLLSDSHIKHEWCDDVQVEIWLKFLFIAAYGLVTASSGKTLGGVYADLSLREQCGNIMEEIAAIAEKADVLLPRDAVALSLEKAKNFPHDTQTSFQRDYEQGKRDERELFRGAILSLAHRYGVPVTATEDIRLLSYGNNMKDFNI